MKIYMCLDMLLSFGTFVFESTERIIWPRISVALQQEEAPKPKAPLARFSRLHEYAWHVIAGFAH